MPLRQALDLATARAEIIRLQLEVTRLEHALAAASILEATLRPTEVIISEAAKGLSPRETEVLTRIMAGDSTDQIAHTMYVSQSTVKAFVQRIYTKLDVHNRGAAAAAGVHMGLDQEDNDEDL